MWWAEDKDKAQIIWVVQPCCWSRPHTGWRRRIGCLIFIGHFPHKTLIIDRSLARRNLQFEASNASLPPCVKRLGRGAIYMRTRMPTSFSNSLQITQIGFACMQIHSCEFACKSDALFYHLHLFDNGIHAKASHVNWRFRHTRGCLGVPWASATQTVAS